MASNNDYVVNNSVKMNWVKSKFLLARKKKGTKGEDYLIFAAVDYPSATKGNITVFFNPSMAWLWITDAHESTEDIWNSDELKSWISEPENYTDHFPASWDECVALVSDGEEISNEALLEEYGLLEYKSDIEARVRDLYPYYTTDPISMRVN